MQETVDKNLQEDTLFQDQKFVYKRSGRGPGMYHLVKEIEEIDDGIERYTTLCGITTTIGSPESLTAKAQGTGHTHDNPRFFRTCTRGRQIFESRTGRKPREDMEKYDKGENQ